MSEKEEDKGKIFMSFFCRGVRSSFKVGFSM